MVKKNGANIQRMKKAFIIARKLHKMTPQERKRAALVAGKKYGKKYAKKGLQALAKKYLR